MLLRFGRKTNLTGVFTAVAGLEQGMQPGVLERLRRLPYQDVAEQALTIVAAPGEERYIALVVAGVMAISIPNGYNLYAGVPNIVTQGLASYDLLHRATYRSREAKALELQKEFAGLASAKGMTLGELRRDVASLRTLIQLWVTTPATHEQDPASGKIRKDRDLGQTDEQIVQRIELILGLDGSKKSTRSMEMDDAAEKLTYVLERFSVAIFGENQEQAFKLSPQRVADWHAAIVMAWVSLIADELPGIAERQMKVLLKQRLGKE